MACVGKDHGLWARSILPNGTFTSWDGTDVGAVGTSGGFYWDVGFTKAYFFFSTYTGIGWSVFDQGKLMFSRAVDGQTVAAPSISNCYLTNGTPYLFLWVVGGDANSVWVRGGTLAKWDSWGRWTSGIQG